MVKFSIIVVCLNPGEGLNRTLDSILAQTYGEYEVVVKDGGSSDGSLEDMRGDTRIRLYKEPDTGIYDAMNQAVRYAEGDLFLFLNCGDILYDGMVLERTAKRAEASWADRESLVLYGDTYGAKRRVMIASPQKIDGMACFRNIPCHQSCFYSASLCREKSYDTTYRIRADYDHFLWCYYVKGARMEYMGFPVSSYEGGGFSEARENRRQDLREHKRITSAYMRRRELFCYNLFMFCTLAPVRRFLAENRFFAGGYHWLKGRIRHIT